MTEEESKTKVVRQLKRGNCQDRRIRKRSTLYPYYQKQGKWKQHLALPARTSVLFCACFAFNTDVAAHSFSIRTTTASVHWTLIIRTTTALLPKKLAGIGRHCRNCICTKVNQVSIDTEQYTDLKYQKCIGKALTLSTANILQKQRSTVREPKVLREEFDMDYCFKMLEKSGMQ